MTDQSCWRIIAPLASKATRIFSDEDYKNKTNRITDLMPRAGALRKTHPELLEEATRLAAREAPPRPDDVMSMLRHLRTELPASTVTQLKQQIDFKFPGTLCQAILWVEKELHRCAGPPPADCLALMSETGPLVEEEEINSLEERIAKIEEEQQKIDDAERERSEAEQRQAKARLQMELLERDAEADVKPKAEEKRDALQVQAPAEKKEDQEANNRRRTLANTTELGLRLLNELGPEKKPEILASVCPLDPEYKGPGDPRLPDIEDRIWKIILQAKRRQGN
jgi:hypothetical protein